jgi:hypothetical protein
VREYDMDQAFTSIRRNAISRITPSQATHPKILTVALYHLPL